MLISVSVISYIPTVSCSTSVTPSGFDEVTIRKTLKKYDLFGKTARGKPLLSKKYITPCIMVAKTNLIQLYLYNSSTVIQRKQGKPQ